MSDFNRMVYQHTIKESNKIKKICAPLHQQFQVKHFWYSQTTQDGNYFSLASNPEMHDYYHSSNLHRFSPFFHDPLLIEPGFYFYSAIQDQKFQQTFNDCSDKLQMSFGGSLVIKQESIMYRFGYAFDKKVGTSISNIILNNISLLQKFNDYFVKEANCLIKKAQEDCIHLPTEMGACYHEAPKGMGYYLNLDAKFQFLDSLGLIRQEMVKKLSKREVDILKLFHAGLNARQIAAAVYVSPRTVEKHLESIKNKLNCFKKTDLHRQAHLLHHAGLF